MFRTILRALQVVASVLFIVSLVLWIAAALWPPGPTVRLGRWTFGRWYVDKTTWADFRSNLHLSVQTGDLRYRHTWHVRQIAKPFELDWKWKGIRVATGTRRSRRTPPRRFIDVKLRAWALVGLVGVIPITLAVAIPLQRFRVRRSGRCERCKYYLKGLPDREYGDIATRIAAEARQDLLEHGRRLIRCSIAGMLFGIVLIVGLSVVSYYLPKTGLRQSHIVDFIVFPLLPLTQTSTLALLWLSTIAYYAALFFLCGFLLCPRVLSAHRIGRDSSVASQDSFSQKRCPECGVKIQSGEA